MNELQLFNNEEFGEIRGIEINGEPYFVAKDVALALGYKDTTNAIKDSLNQFLKSNSNFDAKSELSSAVETKFPWTSGLN